MRGVSIVVRTAAAIARYANFLFEIFVEYAYSLRPKKNDVLGFKICPKKNDILLNLACLHVYVAMQQSIST
jgi:hypothetical protein